MNSINKTARLAGFLYLMYMVIEIPADVLARSPLIVFGDAAATATNIMAHEWQFRVGIVGDLLAGVLFFLAAWALYTLLKPVNKDLALLFLLLNLGGVAVRFAIDLNYVAALLLSIGTELLKVFQADQLQALAMAFFYFQKNGYWVSQIFFGVWLFPLGYLVFKSGFLPRFLGIILMVHCFTWTTTSLLYFLSVPGYTALTYISFPLGFIAEFGLTLWLLIRGLRTGNKMEPKNITRSNEMITLTVGGGLGFWLANFAISLTPIAAEYRAALSISYYPMLLAALIGGLLIAFCVSHFLLRFFDNIPASNPVRKSVILSFIVLVIVTILLGGPSSFLATGDVLRYFIIGTMFNTIRILALGIALGYLHDRLNKGVKI